MEKIPVGIHSIEVGDAVLVGGGDGEGVIVVTAGAIQRPHMQ